MIYLYIWLFPVLAGIVSWALKNKKLNTMLVFLHSLLHLVVALVFIRPDSAFVAALGLDSLNVWFFLISAILYFAVGLYSLQSNSKLTSRQSSIYAICMMAFVASMDGANLSRDLGLIWVFVESTTLASAMLISFEHHKQSLEAAWKYLFICSIGIALAFVGILLLLIAQTSMPSLMIDKIMTMNLGISPFWLKISFVFMLIGFGTKVGLAPLHFWLPDAHSEAPAAVSALLSGALLNTALLPLIRMLGIMKVNNLGYLASQLFMVMGLLSMFVAAVFILKIKNYKRMLAYSSIENMGIIMIAFALGDLAGKAGLMHVMGHSLIKAAFFLTAGNVYNLFGQKEYDKCTGLLALNPISGWLWLLCFMAIIGMPPSPLFISEFYIAFALMGSGNIFVLVVYFILLASIAYGLGRAALAITMGASDRRVKLSVNQYLPQIGLLLCAVAVPLIMQYLF